MTSGADRPEVDYMIVGSPKCGTTTIASLLADHPEVFLTTPKEPGFFCPWAFEKRKSWEWYASLFQRCASTSDNLVKGEATVNYTCSRPETLVDPRVIHQFYPQLKVIFLLRDPIRRFESHWLHHSIMGHPRDVPVFSKASTHYSMFLDTSRYWNHISRWRRFFPDEQIHVGIFELFRADPVRFMKNIYAFLRVDSAFDNIDCTRHVNPSNRHPFVDGRLAKTVRRLPGFVELRDKSPRFVRTALRRLVRTKNTEPPSWDPDVRRWVVSELDHDARETLAYAGVDQQVWESFYDR